MPLGLGLGDPRLALERAKDFRSVVLRQIGQRSEDQTHDGEGDSGSEHRAFPLWGDADVPLMFSSRQDILFCFRSFHPMGTEALEMKGVIG